ncbi:exported hypothetical protein [Cupriavidus oxalaticus]|uniref:Uncharacterized protein n=1 Tax=Cupriavidus oxalaticus TaxID=96344 RepID=A0A375FR37_9BURK|nr:exported hypothetical protein [Cupriavidus oxalaticus]
MPLKTAIGRLIRDIGAAAATAPGAPANAAAGALARPANVWPRQALTVNHKSQAGAMRFARAPTGVGRLDSDWPGRC